MNYNPLIHTSASRPINQKIVATFQQILAANPELTKFFNVSLSDPFTFQRMLGRLTQKPKVFFPLVTATTISAIQSIYNEVNEITNNFTAYSSEFKEIIRSSEDRLREARLRKREEDFEEDIPSNSKRTRFSEPHLPIAGPAPVLPPTATAVVPTASVFGPPADVPLPLDTPAPLLFAPTEFTNEVPLGPPVVPSAPATYAPLFAQFTDVNPLARLLFGPPVAPADVPLPPAPQAPSAPWFTVDERPLFTV
ncbi:MAG: hypothetical protein RLZ12_709 [Bacillota bacterium]|jgi:hypothetical protein